MSTHQFVIDKFTMAMSARDVEQMSDLLTDDTKLVNIDGEAVEGKREVLTAWVELFKRMIGATLVITGHHDGGKYFTIAGRGDFQNGKSIPLLWQAELDGDRICSWQAFLSTPERVKAFGLDKGAEAH